MACCVQSVGAEKHSASTPGLKGRVWPQVPQTPGQRNVWPAHEGQLPWTASCFMRVSVDDHRQLLKGGALSRTFKNSPRRLSGRLVHRRGTGSFVTQCQKSHPKAQGMKTFV